MNKKYLLIIPIFLVITTLSIFLFLKSGTSQQTKAIEDFSFQPAPIDSNYLYQSTNQPFKVYLGNRFQENKPKVKIEQENSALEFSLALTDAFSASPSAQEKSIVYKNVYPGTDAVYSLQENGIKEEIIIYNQEALAHLLQLTANSLVFTFDMSLSNLIPKKSTKAEASFSFLDPTNGQSRFYIPKPFMVDGAGERSEEIEIELRESKESGNYQLILTPSLAWLSDSRRIYPLVIDPTVTVDTSTSGNATAYSFQRKTWYDDSRYWIAFHSDADNRIEFWYSADGTSWNENASAQISVDTNDFSIEADSSDVFIAYTDGNDVKAAEDSGGYPAINFGWGSATTVYDASWWNSSWQYRFKYTIPNANLPDGESLTNFPLHIDLTNDAPSAFWTHVDSAGDDIRVVDCDNATQLEGIHLEGWNYGSSKGHIWVKKDIAEDTGSNTDCAYVYYGNGSASSDWDENAAYNTAYQAVWHMDESSGTRYDSTSKGNNLTENGTGGVGSTTDGKIDTAAEFETDDSDYLSITDASQTGLELGTDDYTIEFWVNHETEFANQSFFVKRQDEYHDEGFVLGWPWTDPKFQVKVDHQHDWSIESETSSWNDDDISTGTWYYYTVTWDQSTGDLIFGKNASFDAADNMATTSTGNDRAIWIGADERWGQYLDGVLDEFRVSSTPRSAEWLEFSYNSDKGDGGSAEGEEVNKYSYPSITKDSNNKVWITARHYETGTVDELVGASNGDRSDHDDGAKGLATHTLVSIRRDAAESIERIHGGLQFTSISIPQGSTVNVAYSELYFGSSIEDDMYSSIYCEDAASPADFTFAEAHINDRTWTTDSVNWDEEELAWDWRQSPSLVDPIQEIVTDYAVTKINLLFIADTGTNKKAHAYSWDTDDHEYAPKLHIEWSNHKFQARQATTDNDISTWQTATTLDQSGNTNKYGTIVPLTSGDMYATWIDGTAIEGKVYDSSDTQWEDSNGETTYPDGIDTGVIGMSKNMSAVSDSSGNVHLTYIDNSNYVKYQEYTTSWQTAVTLDSSSGNEYPTISIDTASSDDLYVFWIRNDDIFYKKGSSPYGSSDWDVSATTLEGTGTNDWVTASYEDFGSNSNFVTWAEGSGSPYDINFNFVGAEPPAANFQFEGVQMEGVRID